MALSPALCHLFKIPMREAQKSTWWTCETVPPYYLRCVNKAMAGYCLLAPAWPPPATGTKSYTGNASPCARDNADQRNAAVKMVAMWIGLSLHYMHTHGGGVLTKMPSQEAEAKSAEWSSARPKPWSGTTMGGSASCRASVTTLPCTEPVPYLMANCPPVSCCPHHTPDSVTIVITWHVRIVHTQYLIFKRIQMFRPNAWPAEYFKLGVHGSV